jgi:transposase
MKRHELNDEQWALISGWLPLSAAKTGRPARDPRTIWNGIFWILRTGAPWRDLPERFGPWQTVYDHFSRWRRSGVFARIVREMQVRLDREGRIDWNMWCVDGTQIRATRAAAGATKKVSGATRLNRATTHWACAEEDSGQSCTWLLTAKELR